MKQKSVIMLVAAWMCVWSHQAASPDNRRSNMTVMVFPIRLRVEIMTDERTSRDTWPERKEKYESVVRGSTERLIRGLIGEGFRMGIEGTAPVIPDRQQGTTDGALWPFIRSSLMADADAFLLCDITSMEYSERIGHYAFEIYSVHTYRMTASFDVLLVDARAGKILKAATVNDSATHRVHRLFWDTIWIHHYTTGPDVAEKLMESATAKIVRSIR